MSRSRFTDDPDPNAPLVGASLRYALAHVEQRILDALAVAGFGDIQIAHFKVLRFPPPENERPIDLAQRAGTTKQAMNYLLSQLEGLGYLERGAGDSPSARLISLTEKGWQVAQIQRATVRLIERELEEKVGARRFQTFYAVLKAIIELPTAGDDSH